MTTTLTVIPKNKENFDSTTLTSNTRGVVGKREDSILKLFGRFGRKNEIDIESKSFHQEDDDDEISDLKKLIDGAKLPEKVLRVISKEFKRLQGMQTTSPDYSVIRNYIEVSCFL